MNLKSLAIAAAVLLLTACASLTKTDGNAWLETKAGPSNEQMAGKWTSAGNWTANWGEGNFIQDGYRFYGHMGSYYVDGALNGDHLYMVFTSGKKLYYSAILKKTGDGSYSGKATQGRLIDYPGAEDSGVTLLNLRRLRN
jgi:hypothetical protein